MEQTNNIMAYLEQKKERVVSPIWDGKKEFHFLCMGHLEFSEALGFKSTQITPVLRQIVPDALTNEEQLYNIKQQHYFDKTYIQNEYSKWYKMKHSKKEGMYGGGCFGPLTIASDILGVNRLLRFIRKDAPFVHQLVDYITSAIIELSQHEIRWGYQFFWIAEPLASLLSPDNFWEFSGSYLKKIYNTVRIPGFLHVCGPTLKYTSHMVRTTAQVLSIDSMTDMGQCLKLVPPEVIVMGNISPATLRFETIATIRTEIQQLNHICNNYSNAIISTGCSVMDGTKKEVIELLFKETNAYKRCNRH